MFKNYLKAAYTLIGTGVLVVMISIMGYNFFYDSRLLAHSTTDEDKPYFQNTKPEVKQDKDGTTLIFKKNQDNTSTASATKTPSKTSTPTPSPTKTVEPTKGILRIQILFAPGYDPIAEKYKNTLENKGYIVDVSVNKSIKSGTTQIIERNNKGAGKEIYKAIKTGVILNVPDKSNYDVTVIVGKDGNP